jgi:hypothetical protein
LHLGSGENPSWDPSILKEALTVYLFSLDRTLDKAELVISDQRVFPVLLNIYLNTLLLLQQ